MLRLLSTLMLAGVSACAHPPEPTGLAADQFQTDSKTSKFCEAYPIGSQVTSLLIFSIGNGISIVTLGSPVLIFNPILDCDHP